MIVKMNQFNIDWPLFAGLIILMACGLFVIYSSSNQEMGMIIRQCTRMGIGIIVMLFFAQLKYETLVHWSPYIYTGGMLLLVFVMFLGITGKGAQRWLNFGIFRIQPSEFMKLGVPMMVAWIIIRMQIPPGFKSVCAALAVIAMPLGLILIQPDLGTALLVASSGIIVLFLAGISWRLIIFCLILLAAAAPFLWQNLLPYQQQRVLTLLNPWIDPLGSGYHTIQSMIAIGSGGIYGKGWLNGSQSRLEFIPEQSTDFIFSVLAEEFGLIGGLAILCVYLFIIIRCLKIAFSVKHTYSRLLCGGLIATFFFYIFVNIGMVCGILPVVGVPLPLVSYGGTSIVTLMASFGIMMSLSNQKKLMH